MRITLLIGLLLLIGCAPIAPSAPSAPPPSSSLAPTAPYLAPRNTEEAATAATCAGRLDRVGKLQALRCIVTYADAGKACTDGAQCLGQRCMGETKDEGAVTPVAGRCVATSDPFGCQTIIRAGKAATLCVD